jgi:hypothetical protein
MSKKNVKMVVDDELVDKARAEALRQNTSLNECSLSALGG